MPIISTVYKQKKKKFEDLKMMKKVRKKSVKLAIKKRSIKC